MEEEDLDGKRRAYFVTELLKAEETKQSHLNVLSDERYSELLEEVRQAEMATKKTPLQYRRLSRFNILQVDGVERLISRTAKNGLRPYLKVDEVYEVLRKVHDSGGGHSGRDKMFSQIAKLYANVTKEMVLVYLACCQVCQGRQNKKQVGDEGGSPSLKLEEAEIKNEMQTTDETPTSFNEFDPGDTKPFKLEEYATVKDEMQTTDESPTGFNEFDQEDTKPIKLEETEMLRKKRFPERAGGMRRRGACREREVVGMTCLVKPVIHLVREGPLHRRMEQQLVEQQRGARHPSRSYWPREVMLSFLQLYRSLECLWRVRSPDYTNRAQREKAYDVLLKKVREVEPQADREYIACKINSIRTSFRKELVKVKRSQKLAHWTGEVYKPRLWYYDHMLFVVEQGKDGESPEPTKHSGEEEGSLGTQYWYEEEASYKEEEEMEIVESKPIIMEDGSVIQATTSWDETSNPPVEAIVSSPDNLTEPVCQQNSVESQTQAGKRKASPVPRTNGCAPKRVKVLEEEPLLRQAMQVLLRGRDEHGAFGDYLAHELRSLRSERFRRKLKSRVRKAIVEVVEEEAACLDGLE